MAPMTARAAEALRWIEATPESPRLEGRYGALQPGAAAVVAPPHPEYGGHMDHPVVDALVAGLAGGGLATLRFNWRGAGRSGGGITGEPSAARADYAAAFAQLAQLHPGPYLATGYSFGAATALAVAARDTRLTRLVLVGPPAGLLPRELLDVFTGDALVIVGDDDHYAPLARIRPILAPHPRFRLEVIAGADHFFATGGVERIAPLVTAFVRSGSET